MVFNPIKLLYFSYIYHRYCYLAAISACPGRTRGSIVNSSYGTKILLDTGARNFCNQWWFVVNWILKKKLLCSYNQNKTNIASLPNNFNENIPWMWSALCLMGLTPLGVQRYLQNSVTKFGTRIKAGLTLKLHWHWQFFGMIVLFGLITQYTSWKLIICKSPKRGKHNIKIIVLRACDF